MKKRIILFISIIQIVALSACGKAANVPPIVSGITESEPARNSRVLIAYFSQPTDVDTSGLDAVSSASVVVRDGP
ncbi:MAG: hypothetical protein K2L82_03925 [Lachnospiraceae bacterium]|nr:hypothetical protein [Lachnospiraceae bacterium]